MATTLETQLSDLVRDHNLESLNVTCQLSSVDGNGDMFMCTSVRSADGHFEVTTQGSIAEQIKVCLGGIAAKRAAVVVPVPELVAAA